MHQFNSEEELEEFEHNHPDEYMNPLPSHKITMSDIIDHMTGPVLSAVLHIVLLGLLGSIVVFRPPAVKKEIVVDIKHIKPVPIKKPPEPPKPPEDPTDPVDVDIVRPDVKAADDVNVETDNISTTDNTTQAIDDIDITSIRPNNSTYVMSGLFSLRGKEGRKGAKQYGYNSKTERAVKRALEWLAAHQNQDGSWGDTPSMSPALTSLALLTFLSHGETPQSPKYGTVVYKAINKCMEFANTGIGRRKGLITNNSRGYGHAMVAYALSESYALTKIPLVKKAMNQMLKTIISGINSDGSFNYDFNNKPLRNSAKTKVKAIDEGKPRCDLSIGGWNYQALKAGFAAGATVEGLEGAIEQSIQGLKVTHRTKNGGFSYGRGIGGGARESMTAIGVLCLQLFGEKESKEARNGLKLLEGMKTSPNAKPLKMDWKASGVGPYFSLYTWYYKTQAIFQGHNGKGGAWRVWDANMKKELLRRQERDGHWSSPSQLYQAEKWRKLGGHGEHYSVPGEEHKATFATDIDLYIYSTSLCALMLQVYYRYLPSFKVVHGKHSGAKTSDDDDDDLLDTNL